MKMIGLLVLVANVNLHAASIAPPSGKDICSSQESCVNSLLEYRRVTGLKIDLYKFHTTPECRCLSPALKETVNAREIRRTPENRPLWLPQDQPWD